MDILEKLGDLHKQATTERSHFYVASTVIEAIHEISTLRLKLNTSDNTDYAKCARELIALTNDGEYWLEQPIIDVIKKHFA